MKRTGIRARVAIGLAVMATAACVVAGPLSASPKSASPSTPPDSSEPAETVAASAPIELDPEREAIVDGIMSGAEMAGFPLDRDCVAGLVAQIPDEDVASVAAEIAAETATAGDVAVATPATAPELTVSAEPADSAAPATEPVDPMTAESVTPASGPVYSQETAEIGRRMLECVHGDADPALVEEVLAVIESDPEAPEFDMACIAGLLTTFSDETLTMMLEDESALPSETAASVDVSVETVGPATVPGSDPMTEAPATEPGAEDTALVNDPVASLPDDTVAEAMSLLVCERGLIEELAAESEVVEDAVVEDPIASIPTGTASDETVVAGDVTETTTS